MNKSKDKAKEALERTRAAMFNIQKLKNKKINTGSPFKPSEIKQIKNRNGM